MANETATKTATATNGKAKDKKPQAPRVSSKEKVKQGNKGILKVLVAASFSLAKQNENKGTVLAGNESGQHGLIYSVTKENGRIDRLDDKGEMYKSFLAKGKAALADIEKGSYTKAVQEFIDETTKLRSPKESIASVLKGVKFE